MTVNEYLPKQFNGAVINAVAEAIENEFKDADAVESYLYGLRIDTAQETELNYIGCILGYPRPLVPEGLNEEGLFTFTNPPPEEDPETGFSDITGTIGGKLASTEPSDSNYLAPGLYRQFLKWVAYIKRYGVTLYSVDRIAYIVDNDYTLEYDEYGDIILTFNINIGYKMLWLVTNLFERFSVMPQVKIRTEVIE